jgi:hypothetical protein
MGVATGWAPVLTASLAGWTSSSRCCGAVGICAVGTADGRCSVATIASNMPFLPNVFAGCGEVCVLATTGSFPNLDLAPDGKRFVVISEGSTARETASLHAIFVVNFFDELKRRMP